MGANDLPTPTLENIRYMLRTCRQTKDLALARLLQVYMYEHEVELHCVLGNHLVPTLVDCGCLLEAQQALERLPHRNELSWSSVISGYSDSGALQQALLLYSKMQEDFVQPKSYTFVALLTACARCDDACTGRVIHSDVIHRALDSDVFIGNTLVNLYCKRGSLTEAQKVFDMLLERDAVSWNVLIAGYADHGQCEKAIGCFEQMQLQGVPPADVTLLCTLKACASLRFIEKGKLLSAEATKRGFERDLIMGSTIVDMYAKCGSLVEAQKMFDQLRVRNAISWTALISGYAECGYGEKALEQFKQMHLGGLLPDAFTFASGLKACGLLRALETGLEIHAEIIKVKLESDHYIGNTLVDLYAKCNKLAEARQIFDKLCVRDGVSWDALISGYGEYGLDDDVLNCVEQMLLDDVSVDAITLVRCLKACSTLGALKIGRELHHKIRKSGLEHNLFIGNTLIDMYGQCGSLVEGREVFDKQHVHDVVSWNAMIKAYGENHEGNMALLCFDDMLAQGVKPDAVTFTCLLVACSHACMVAKGQKYFKAIREHGIEPSNDHYACMVDILARSGKVYEAQRFVEAMQCLPSKETIKALLTACKVYGDVELGLRCFQKLLKIDREDASPYLLMAEVFANVGRWNDANRVEEIRKYARAKKKPATASIEVEGRLHEYAISNNHSTNILTMLETLSSRVKGDGYVACLDLVLKQSFDEDRDVVGDENCLRMFNNFANSVNNTFVSALC